jgi:hypothetical protein
MGQARQKLSRLAKWSGLVAVALILLLEGASICFDPWLSGPIPDGFPIHNGALTILWGSPLGPGVTPWRLLVFLPNSPEFRWWFVILQLADGGAVWIPLWFVALALAFPTAWLWLRDQPGNELGQSAFCARLLASRLLVWLVFGVVLNVAVTWALACKPISGLPNAWPAKRSAAVTREVLGPRMDASGACPSNATMADLVGWPFRSLRRIWVWDSRDSVLPGVMLVSHGPGLPRESLSLPAFAEKWIGRHEQLPLRPLWPGFLLNSLLYTVPVALVWLAPGVIKRWLRNREGHCSKCGYDLIGLAAGANCPECGSGTQN